MRALLALLIAAPASNGWIQNNFSVSSSGKLFDMAKVREYGGDRTLGAPPERATVNPTVSGCEKWAVITSIYPPTQLVRTLSSLAGWCTVVVGDKSSPPDYAAGGSVHYLSPDAQEALPFEVLAHLPWNHFGRKNVGYLYAMLNGARVIYDTDDDNQLHDVRAMDAAAAVGVVGDTFAVFGATLNPYPFFQPGTAATHTWPRGLPLTQIKETAPRYLLARGANTCVIQSLANLDPDVDAIFRLSQRLPMNFGLNSTVAAVPPWSFAPFNSQATMFRTDALWALLLPVGVHGRVTDIWRGYFAQVLMARTSCGLAFSSPWATQIRNPHNLMADFQAEEDLYLKAGALVRHLQQPQAGDELGQLMLNLYIDMYERGVLGEGDPALVRAWIRDLARVGYVLPAVRPPPPARKKWAVCVSGQPRTIAAAIENIRSQLLDRLDGGYDVFMFVQSGGTDGEPAAGDAAFCAKYFEHVHCRVELEVPIAFEALSDIWPTFHYHDVPKNQHGFLQQLYGMHIVNQMRENHTLATGQSYDYTVRLRPDDFFYTPFPGLPDTPPPSVVWYSNPALQCCGNEDIFNVGHTDDMRIFMDRYRWLFDDGELRHQLATAGYWNAEMYARWYSEKHGIEMRVLEELSMHSLGPADPPALLHNRRP